MYLTKQTMKRLLFIVPLIVFFLGCKKEKAELNPLLCDWKIKSIYMKYTDPVNGLVEETVDVNKFLSERGFYPTLVKEIHFFDKDSVIFIAPERGSVFSIGEKYHIQDPGQSLEESRGTFELEGNFINVQFKYDGGQSNSKYRYALDKGGLQLITRDIDQKVEGRQVTHKEIWFLEK